MKVNSSPLPASTAPQQGSKPSAANGPKESVGDIANRVANSGKPSGRKVQGKGNPSLDKDAFFKLMIAQVKNQDPTNPLKNHEMAAQLAQFSSLEQMSNVNETLKGMAKGQGENSQFQALNLMGKMVRGDSSKLSRTQGEASHDLTFNLKDAAAEVNISVANAQGEVVKRFSLQNIQKGPGKIQWDGKADDGSVAGPGSYRIGVEAKSADGQRVNTETEFSGKVTGVQFTEAGPIVSIGKKTVPLKDIKQIEEFNSQNSSQAEAAQSSLQKMIPAAAKMGVPMEQVLPNMGLNSQEPQIAPNLDLASLQNNLKMMK